MRANLRSPLFPRPLPFFPLLQGRKWVVENHAGNREIVISDTEPRQTVYIFNCNNCTIQVRSRRPLVGPSQVSSPPPHCVPPSSLDPGARGPQPAAPAAAPRLARIARCAHWPGAPRCARCSPCTAS